MEQVTLLHEQVRRKYILETELFRLACRAKSLKEKLEEARGELYAAKADLHEYEAGGLAPMLDKLRGRYPEKIESLVRRMRRAEFAVSSLEGENVSLRLKTEAANAELASLAGCEERLAELDADPADQLRWRAAFLCRAAIPALEESHKALLEYRKLIQGSTLEILTYAQQQAIQGEADAWGEKCRKLLMAIWEILESTGADFSLKGYYTVPTAYIVSAAAEHNRRNRLNKAIDQSLAYRRQLQELLAQLED